MTPERAREIEKEQHEFPYWGNFRKFMTADEIAEVEEHVRESLSGNISFALVVRRHRLLSQPQSLDLRMELVR